MMNRIAGILLPFLAVSLLWAQYQVGDVVGDFSAISCANQESDFHLYDYNGNINDGGDYYVIWIVFLVPW